MLVVPLVGQREAEKTYVYVVVTFWTRDKIVTYSLKEDISSVVGILLSFVCMGPLLGDIEFINVDESL